MGHSSGSSCSHSSAKCSISANIAHEGDVLVWASGGDAFLEEENFVVDLVGNMLDYKLVKAAVSVLASQEDLSAKSLIKKLRINGKKVASTINGTHTLMKVDAREVGGNSDFVLLNFAYRDPPSKPFLSLVFDRSYILKQYISILKNPKTGVVQTYSLCDYRNDESLGFHVYCEAMTPESTHFEVGKLFNRTSP